MCLSRISFVHSFYIISMVLYITRHNIQRELSSYLPICAKMQIAISNTRVKKNWQVPVVNMKKYRNIWQKTTLPDKCIFQCKKLQKEKKKQQLKHSRYKYLVNGNNAPLSDSRPALVFFFFLFTNNLRHINLNLRDLNKLHYFAHTRFV